MITSEMKRDLGGAWVYLTEEELEALRAIEDATEHAAKLHESFCTPKEAYQGATLLAQTIAKYRGWTP